MAADYLSQSIVSHNFVRPVSLLVDLFGPGIHHLQERHIQIRQRSGPPRENPIGTRIPRSESRGRRISDSEPVRP